MTSSTESNLSQKLQSDYDIVQPLTMDQALSFYIECKMNKYQYIQTRLLAKSRNADIFPPYYKLLEAKKSSYPDASSIQVNEYSAQISLQGLLNITSTSLLQSMTNEELNKVPSEIFMISKYGGDGASSQSQYKQVFKKSDEVDEEEEERQNEDDISDAHVFMVSLSPLRMCDENNISSTYWQNLRPGSPRYCRPIKFIFATETEDRVTSEMRDIEYQIDVLKKGEVVIGERSFSVKHTLLPSMVDGKTCQYLTHTKSASGCVVCKATPSEMNDIAKVSQKEEDLLAFQYGLSPLHAKIRFMEYVLHIAYNLKFKKWQATKKGGFAELKENKKREIQQKFKEQMGLQIDFVKQGSGTTNDGNTARRFFANPSITSAITGVNKNVIQRCSTILSALSCSRDVDADKFDKYAMDTYR